MQTDDRGEYRFHDLAAGKYYIAARPDFQAWIGVDRSANAGPIERSIPTIYPGVTDMTLAVPIEVSPGRHVTGVDVTLLRSRVFPVSGRVLNAPATGHLTVLLRNPKNVGMTDYEAGTSTKNADGDFEFRNVPPGSYELILAGHSLSGKTSVTVGGSEVKGVRLVAGPGAEVKLHAIAEGEEKPDMRKLGFSLMSDNRSGHGSSLLDTGQRSIRHLPPDHYTLQLFGTLLRQFYVKTARAGEANVLVDGVTVTGSETVDIEVTLASDGAGVEGLVRDKDQEQVPGATILLAPGDRSRTDLFRSTTSDQNGHYEFAMIAPGNYKLFAWEEIEPKEWLDPGFLDEYEPQGEKAALEANADKVVDLHVGSVRK